MIKKTTNFNIYITFLYIILKSIYIYLALTNPIKDTIIFIICFICLIILIYISNITTELIITLIYISIQEVK